MEVAHDELVEAFEEFEADLEVEDILKKVKEELAVSGLRHVTEFGEKLKEREQLKEAAQATRAARAVRTSTSCATLNTPATGISRGWTIVAIIGGTNSKGQPPLHQHRHPSPDVRRKRSAPPQSPLQEARKRCPNRHPSERPKEPQRRRGETDRCFQPSHRPQLPMSTERELRPRRAPVKYHESDDDSPQRTRPGPTARRAVADKRYQRLEYLKRYRATHRAQRAESDRRYRERHRERIRESHKRFRERHRERIREKDRRYFQANKERIRARQRLYRQRHIERAIERS